MWVSSCSASEEDEHDEAGGDGDDREVLGDGQAGEFEGAVGAEGFEKETGDAVEDEHKGEDLAVGAAVAEEEVEDQA